MLFKTHLAFGLLIGIITLSIFQPATPWVFMLVLLVGSAMPDIDHPESKIGKKVKIIGLLFEHRGFFHSFFAIVLFPIAFYLAIGSLQFSIAFLIGYASHILLDSLSIQGIMPVHPFSRFRLKGFFRTGALYEYILLICLVCLDSYLLFT